MCRKISIYVKILYNYVEISVISILRGLMKKTIILTKLLFISFIFSNANASMDEKNFPPLNGNIPLPSLKNSEIQEQRLHLEKRKKSAEETLCTLIKSLEHSYPISLDCNPTEIAIIEDQVNRLLNIDEQLEALTNPCVLSSKEEQKKTKEEKSKKEFTAQTQPHTNLLSQEEDLQNLNTTEEIITYIEDLHKRVNLILDNSTREDEKGIEAVLEYAERELKECQKQLLLSLKQKKKPNDKAEDVSTSITLLEDFETERSTNFSFQPNFPNITPTFSIQQLKPKEEDCYNIYTIEKDLKKKINDLETKIKNSFSPYKKYSLGITLASCNQQLAHIKKTQEVDMLVPTFSSENSFNQNFFAIFLIDKRKLQEKESKFQNKVTQKCFFIKNQVFYPRENFSSPASSRGYW